jgi:hypothetical protein
MKNKYFLPLLLLLFASNAYLMAQPAKTTMLAKVKDEFNIDLISHKLIGPGGIDREFENGIWVDYFTQPFEVVQKSDFPEFPVRYKASVRYIKSGSSWIFDQFTVGSSSYLNVPPPEKNDIITQLKSNVTAWIGGNENYAVGEIESIKLPEDPDWYNRKPTEVAFFMVTVFTEKISNTQLEKAEHKYRITMTRETLQSPWKIKWGSEQTDAKKSISKTTLPADEIAQMKSLKQISEESSAQNAMDALPQVAEAPVFHSDKQLFYYIHEKILTSTPQEAEAHLMKVVDKSCYEDGSTVFFKPHHADWINNLVANSEKYKIAYCDYPGVKAEQYGQIEFLNRTLTNFVTFTGKPAEGTWKLIDFRFVPDNGDMLVKMKGNNANCQSKPDLNMKEVMKYKIGEKVTVQFSNGARKCIVVKVDPDMDNRYFVKIVSDISGKGYWIDGSFISK